MVGYSSHDWRKNTDDAVVVDANTLDRLPVKHPKSLKIEEIEVSRLIRVFCNNQESHRRSVK